MTAHGNLKVLNKGQALAAEVHRITAGGRLGDYPELVCRLRAAALSMTVNIAVGMQLGGTPQMLEGLHSSLASVREVSLLAELLADLEVVSRVQQARLEARCDEVSRMLTGLIRHLRGGRTPRPRRA
ncbi:MAG: four helix bundle protein [Gemmatimonadota bacterium]